MRYVNQLSPLRERGGYVNDGYVSGGFRCALGILPSETGCQQTGRCTPTAQSICGVPWLWRLLNTAMKQKSTKKTRPNHTKHSVGFGGVYTQWDPKCRTSRNAIKIQNGMTVNPSAVQTSWQSKNRKNDSATQNCRQLQHTEPGAATQQVVLSTSHHHARGIRLA